MKLVDHWEALMVDWLVVEKVEKMADNLVDSLIADLVDLSVAQ